MIPMEMIMKIIPRMRMTILQQIMTHQQLTTMATMTMTMPMKMEMESQRNNQEQQHLTIWDTRYRKLTVHQQQFYTCSISKKIR